MEKVKSKDGFEFYKGQIVTCPSYYGDQQFEVAEAIFHNGFPSGVAVRTRSAKCPHCRRVIDPPFRNGFLDSSVFVSVSPVTIELEKIPKSNKKRNDRNK